MENVTVLTSSKRNELSVERPEWRHGALAQAFLGALAAAADFEGIITQFGADRHYGERSRSCYEGPAAPRHARQSQRFSWPAIEGARTGTSKGNAAEAGKAWSWDRVPYWRFR